MKKMMKKILPIVISINLITVPALAEAKDSGGFSFNDLNWSKVVEKASKFMETIKKIQDSIKKFEEILEGGIGFDDIKNVTKIVENVDSIQEAIDEGLIDFDSLKADQKTDENDNETTELTIDDGTGSTTSVKEVVENQTQEKITEIENSTDDNLIASGKDLLTSAAQKKGEATRAFIETAENTLELNNQITEIVTSASNIATETANNNVQVADFGSSKEALTAIYTAQENINGHEMAQTGLLNNQLLLQGIQTAKISELATKISKLSLDNSNIIGSLADSYRLLEEVLSSQNIGNALAQKNNSQKDAELIAEKRIKHANAVKNFHQTLTTSTYTMAMSTSSIDTSDDQVRNGVTNANLFSFNPRNIDPNDSLNRSKQFKDLKTLSSGELESLKQAIESKNSSEKSSESGESLVLIKNALDVLEQKYGGLDNAKKILDLSGDKPLTKEDFLKYITINGDSIFASTKGTKDACPAEEKYTVKKTLDCLNGVLSDIKKNPTLANTKYKKIIKKIEDAISVGNDILDLLQATDILPSSCNNANGEEVVIEDLTNIEDLIKGTKCNYD